MAATAGLPEKIGSAVWIDLKHGALDEGITVNIFKKDRTSLNGLLGNKSFGAALGYDFIQRGNLSVSVLAGASHPWSGNLQKGWVPIAGLGVKF